MAKNPATFKSAFEVYTTSSVLGEGGSGRVFAVNDSRGKELALKCLFPDRVSTEKRKRFKNEIEFCSRHQHDNIVRVLDWGLLTWERAECPFYVMSRFPTTLRVLIEKGVPHDQTLPLFNKMLSGVEAAHKLGVIHRDIKPENFLCDLGRDLLAVADFGIAHFEEDIIATDVDTKPSAKLASRDYAAPEQRKKGERVDHRADIFALGMILNEMFTGVVPHGAGYKLISSISPGHAYLDPLVDRMIQQNPGSRPASVEDIKKELIARGNEFVALQKLDAKRREVVPASEPEKSEPVTLVNVDWENNALIFHLNRTPESKWIRRFQQPREGVRSISGAHPSQTQFTGSMATVHADERNARRVVECFKQYLEMANRGYQMDLQIEAKRQEEERRRKLAQELAMAEQKARILKDIKI